jgi:hypothetical protein
MSSENQYLKQKKLQKLLSDCVESVDSGRIERVYEAHGLKWSMKPLNDHESNWRNKYVIPGSLLSLTTSQKAPTLAIGVRAIGIAGEDPPEPVSEFFQDKWDTLAGRAKELLESNPYAKQYFMAETLLEWLSSRGPDFIDKLWDKWNMLMNDQEETDKQLGESSREKESNSSLSGKSTEVGLTQSSKPSPSPQVEVSFTSLEETDV